MKSASDNRVVSRVTQLMYRIQIEDKKSARGQRKVSAGIATPEGQTLVKSFNFNVNQSLALYFINRMLLTLQPG